MHNCLLCKSSDRFHKPCSMTSGAKLHMGFTCTNPVQDAQHSDAYGHNNQFNTMILELVESECWIDGGHKIPSQGCPNFAASEIVDSRLVARA